jgi:UV DNA damage endonuclease
MLQSNVDNNLLFFRITSDLVPFASHPICQFDWLAYLKNEFAALGDYIRSHHIRISMHPGQFTILNSTNSEVLENSIRELRYHAAILDALQLDSSAKIQIHVGGVYGNKETSTCRFIERYRSLDDPIRRRIVIENDDRSYKIEDCQRIYMQTGVPILVDAFHHAINNAGETIENAIAQARKTWKDEDGIPMVDYSSRKPGGSKLSHAGSIDIAHFSHFLSITKPFDFDVMLEIKDKETSALKAVQVARYDKRFFDG